VAAPIHPNSVATGDFNEDGFLDLAVPSWSPNQVSIFLGDGQGGIGSPLVYGLAGAGGPRFAVVGDFNRDGHDDVATANQGSADVSILLGNGAGGLIPFRRFAVGALPWHLTKADFNADGILDLAVANTGSDTVSVLLGIGTGEFLAASSFAVGSSPHGVVAADMNGDGRVDIVSANYGAANVSLLLGDGTGAFAGAGLYPVGPNPFTLAAGDLNGDGRMDIAVPNFGSNTVSILNGAASGFVSGGTLAVGKSPRAVIISDFNQDGRLDIATANYAKNTISVLAGDGAGGFSSGAEFGVGSGPFSLVAADMNGDLVLDIAAADRDGHTVSVLTGSANGEFRAPRVISSGQGPRGIGSADFDSDGNLDLVIVNYGGNNISILHGLGAGQFAVPASHTVGSSPYGPVIGDLTGDGLLDIAVVNGANNNLSVLRGDGAGGFAPQQKWSLGSGTGPRALAYADFNGDGRIDLATANFAGGSISILLGTGSGNFSAPVVLASASGASGIVAADFNADTKVDLAVCNSGAGSTAIFLGNGNGTFAAPTFFSSGASSAAITAGDWDGDGWIDLAVVNETANTLTILRGNGVGGILGTVVYPTGTRPLSIAADELTGDGIIDLVVACATSNTLNVHPGLGNGLFAPSSAFSAGVFARSVAVADLNGDTQPDLAVANQNGNDAWVIFNRNGSLADLAISINNSVSSVRRGASVTYTVTLSNLGPSTITAAILQFVVPSSLAASEVLVIDGAFDPGSGAWTGLNLAAGQSATLQVIGQVSALASGQLSVGVSVASAPGTIDPSQANNSAADTDSVIKGDADLGVSISNGLTSVAAGDAISYSVVVTNGGPIDIENGRIVTQMPAQLQGVVWSCSASPGASCPGSGSGNLDLEVALPAGGEITFTISGTVNPMASAGDLIATAAVSSPADVVDPFTGNNVASDSDILTGNSAPVAISQSISVPEDQSISIILAATDADQDVIAFQINESPAHGVLSGTPPDLVYTPTANYFGADTFTFVAHDGTHSATGVVAITVSPVNDPPTAIGQSLVTSEDVGIALTLSGSDPDGDALTYTIVAPPSLGSLAGGSLLTYIPTANVSGSDAFTFTVSDGLVESTPATVAIQVNPVNDTPVVAQPIPNQTVNGDALLLSVDISSTFTDVETPAASLVITVSSSDPSLVVPVLNGSMLDLQLTPNRGGSAVVGIRAADADGAFVDTSFTVTIIRPGVSVSVSDASRGEDSAGLVFTLSLSGPSAQPVSVDYATVNGSGIAGTDYVPKTGSVTFAAGVTTRTVVVSTIADNIDETNETCLLTLTSAVGAVIGDPVGVGTIVDEETATLTVLDISILESDGGVSQAFFTVSLSVPSDRDISVNFETANISAAAVAGSDYVPTSGSLFFPAGSVTPQLVPVGTIGDLMDENNEAFSFILLNAVNAVIGRAVARGTIVDNDLPPTVSIADASLVEANSGTKTMTFTLTLSAPSGLRTRVRYETADGSAAAGSDYVTKSGEVVFDPGVTTRTVTITTNGDTLLEANETFFVNLHTPTLLTILDGQAVGTIQNND
jgi:uncharacterized repeat protein (TIGR01451 family)